jgi:hypothetical protein
LKGTPSLLLRLEEGWSEAQKWFDAKFTTSHAGLYRIIASFQATSLTNKEHHALIILMSSFS